VDLGWWFEPAVAQVVPQAEPVGCVGSAGAWVTSPLNVQESLTAFGRVARAGVVTYVAGAWLARACVVTHVAGAWLAQAVV